MLRKLYKTFGMDEMARSTFAKRIAHEKAIEAGEPVEDKPSRHGGGDAGYTLIPIIELCRHCPGMVTAMGVSVGLTASAIQSKGTIAQKERWVPELLTLEKVGAWAITEPNSGSDAFGSMLSTARRDGDEYVLNGSKTFITNGPYADTIVFIAKLDEGNDPKDRKCCRSCSTPARRVSCSQAVAQDGHALLPNRRAVPHRCASAATASSARPKTCRRAARRRQGHVPAGALRRGGDGARHHRAVPRGASSTPERVQFGQRIGDFQLIQQKLAKMEVARMNVQNLVFNDRAVEGGKTMTFAEHRR